MPAVSKLAIQNKSKVKRIAFTLNNYDESDECRIRNLAGDAAYLIVGRESCPTTGTKHLQGFINFNKRITFKEAKSKLGDRAHLETARGTDADNQKYCKKDGEIVIEHGVPTTQGQRNDIAAAISTLMDSGGSLKRVAEHHGPTYVKYYRGLTALKAMVCPTPPRDYKTDVYVYWGCPGSGKSKLAYERANTLGRGAYVRSTRTDGTGTEPLSTGGECSDTLAVSVTDLVFYKPRGQWWDGYNGQPSVVIDDFYGWIKYDELLKVCDRYPHKVEVKGGYVEFTSKYIFITSNQSVDGWYKFDNYNPAAIYRRITELRHFDKINGTFINTIDNNIHD